MHVLTLFLLIAHCFAQIRDPETGELASLKFDEKSGSYYFFGLDSLVLLSNKSYQGKFLAASDSLVFFKSESDGGKILEQEIALIDRLVLQTGAKVVKDNSLNENYVTIKKQMIVKKESRIKKIFSFINPFRHIKFIY
tara:strand:+ start:472 stop:885 length:414 start_codon:yes stop_codon:yes gene_type:complete